MLTSLHLKNLGPASDWLIELSPRLNLLAGENGLGKTLVLEAIWSVLACAPDTLSTFRTRQAPDETPQTRAEVVAGLGPVGEVPSSLSARWFFFRKQQTWITQLRDPRQQTEDSLRDPRRPKSLALYARADGSIDLWDAYQLSPKGDPSIAATHLTPAEIFDGKLTDDRRVVCPGLIADWVRWQGEKSEPFTWLTSLLAILAPPGETLVPGEPARVRLDDRRDIPTLTLSYGTVPITLAPAGLRRVLGLIYALVWSWHDHRRAARLLGIPPTRDMVLLLDEPEAHLHPSWQRVFLPAVLEAVRLLAPEAEVQLFVATHAPLVLASVETLFDEAQDDLFLFRRDGAVVTAAEVPFARQGDASSWLESEVFGLASARSREAERAIEAAMAYMRGDVAAAETETKVLEDWLRLPQGEPRPLVTRIHEALKATLPDHDAFWVQWVVTWSEAST